MTAASVILGIDAAWTEKAPSGVAVVLLHNGRWQCRGVAPSYDSFQALGLGASVNWGGGAYAGHKPSVKSLLKASACLCGAMSVDLVAIDMPLSTKPISGRRTADNEVSRQFGINGCSAHSPNTTSPGRIADELRHALATAGYPLATKMSGRQTRQSRALMEVYPHPALLRLMRASMRVPYKVGKSSKYWPDTKLEVRKKALLEQYALIMAALRREIDGISLVLPAARDCPSLSYLKRYEDALDALVCCWVGIRYTMGQAIPYGDADAAIWVPAADEVAQ